MGQACRDNRTSIEKQIDQFRLMLYKFPNLKRYLYNKTHTATYTKAWSSGQFGGNVFKPLGSVVEYKKGERTLKRATKRTRTNLLE